MRPSTAMSSGASRSRRALNETWMPPVWGTSAWATVSMHMATKGQSLQPSRDAPGQQGMSLGITDMALMVAAANRSAAAGVISGAATSPTITKTESTTDDAAKIHDPPSHGNFIL